MRFYPGGSREGGAAADVTTSTSPNMTIRFTPLNELNHQQIDKVLAKFQLISRKESEQEKIEVIKCIKSYDLKFSRYEDSDVLVGFNKANNFHEIKSRDDSVRLFKDISPCNTCGKCVDDKCVGLRCSDCMHFFHNKCTSSPVGKETFKQLINTPDWVKVLCPKCIASTHISEESLGEIKKNLVEIKSQVENNIAHKPTYSDATAKKIGQNVKQTNKLIKEMNFQIKEVNPAEISEQEERTILIRKYKDKEVRNSINIIKCINEHYEGAIIRNARTTAGGSILIEFDDKETADAVKTGWNKDLFGGNGGAYKASERMPTGIIKHVYQDKSQEEMKREITSAYPDAECEFWCTKQDQFMGIIKIKFKTENQYAEAKQNKVAIFRQKYILEKYNPKPKVIICMKCQRFGHIARLCRETDPICGKCSSRNHDTRGCGQTEQNYKCHHCDGNHATGDKKCPHMIERLEEIINRR